MESANTRPDPEEATGTETVGMNPALITTDPPISGTETVKSNPVSDATSGPVFRGNDPEPPNHASITRLAYEIWISGGQQAGTDKANWRAAEITLWTDYVHQVDECHDSPGRVSFSKITS